MSEVSAVAAQTVTICYPDEAPNRMVRVPDTYDWVREVTLSTEQAAELYSQLKVALGL